MPKSRFRLPSPALVISMVALALVLGGTAIAAGTSVPLTRATGTRLIKKLAPTLSVKAAKTVGGQSIKSFSKTVANGDAAQEPVFTIGGLTLTLSCAAGSKATVQATAAQNGAFMRGTETSSFGTGSVGTSGAAAGTPVTVFTPSDRSGTLDLHYLQTDGHRVDVNAAVEDGDDCLIEGFAISS